MEQRRGIDESKIEVSYGQERRNRRYSRVYRERGKNDAAVERRAQQTNQQAVVSCQRGTHKIPEPFGTQTERTLL